MNIVLWILQILLALLFLFSGGTKFVMSAEDMRKMAPDAIQLPMAFVKFIGAVEIVGALGLILPGLTRIKRFLTPLAAWGLVIVMIGAVVVSVMGMGPAAAIFPLITGVLCAVVAYGRRDWK